jgi:hypothetical protein
MMLVTPDGSPPGATAGPVLRDIHLPPEPSWWPPAPGWWLLLGLVLVLLGSAVWWRRRRHAARERQRVLDEVAQLRTRYQRDANGARLAGDLHQLLRRVARVHDPLVAQQRGDAWRATLARVPVDAATLQQLVALEQAMYRADAPFDAAHALTAVEAWLRLALRPRQWKSTEATRA